MKWNSVCVRACVRVERDKEINWERRDRERERDTPLQIHCIFHNWSKFSNYRQPKKFKVTFFAIKFSRFMILFDTKQKSSKESYVHSNNFFVCQFTFAPCSLLPRQDVSLTLYSDSCSRAFLTVAINGIATNNSKRICFSISTGVLLFVLTSIPVRWRNKHWNGKSDE